MKPAGVLTTAAITAICVPVLDHLVTELFLPTVPHSILIRAAIAVAALLLIVFAVKGWHNLLGGIPRPWFPRPLWRIGFWLRHRPSVFIILAQPKVLVEGGLLSRCSFFLTVQRSLTVLPFNAAISFDRAELVMSFFRRGRRHELIFRPVETGGFLSHDVAAKSYDNVMIEFNAQRLPVPVAESPDFARDYQLELRNVEATVRSRKPLGGKLPSARWRWFNVAQTLPIEGELPLVSFGAPQ